MIEPDSREFLWYDIMNLLNQDEDSIIHYYSNLFDKFKLLFSEEREINFCLDCVNECNQKNHNIIKIKPNEIIDLFIQDILSDLKYRNKEVDLYDLEIAMFKRPLGSYFETDKGEITKLEIIKHFNLIKRFIINQLIKIRKDIKFTSYRIPALDFNPAR